MSRVVEFRVLGTPRPAGSKISHAIRRRDGTYVAQADGRPVVVTREPSRHVGAWRHVIAATASDAMAKLGGELFTAAIKLDVVFVFARPKSHYSTGKRRGLIRDASPRYHTHRPDLTKLLRAFEDALTGIVWRDDSQVAITHAVKQYSVADSDIPGAAATIAELEAGKN